MLLCGEKQSTTKTTTTKQTNTTTPQKTTQPKHTKNAGKPHTKTRWLKVEKKLKDLVRRLHRFEKLYIVLYIVLLQVGEDRTSRTTLGKGHCFSFVRDTHGEVFVLPFIFKHHNQMNQNVSYSTGAMPHSEVEEDSLAIRYHKSCLHFFCSFHSYICSRVTKFTVKRMRF